MAHLIKIHKLTATQIVDVYNAVSPRSVKKFSDRDTAIQRVEVLLEKQKKVLWSMHDENCLADLGFGYLFAADYTPVKAKKGHTELKDKFTITVLAAKNPKLKSSKAHRRFALYHDGITIGEYKAACVKLEGKKALPPFKYLMDPRWDEPRGFIQINR